MTDIWPTFSTLPDQTTWTESKEDPAIKTQTDGGYVLSRPRFTRRPRRTWSFGFKDFSNADKLTLDAFWDQVFGGSNAFTWTHPFTGEIVSVRFNKAYSVKYSHYHTGGDHRWEISNIELLEV